MRIPSPSFCAWSPQCLNGMRANAIRRSNFISTTYEWIWHLMMQGDVVDRFFVVMSPNRACGCGRQAVRNMVLTRSIC